MSGLIATPMVVLLAGALALLLLMRAAGPRNRSPLALLIIGVAFLVLLFLARDLPAEGTISRWRPFFESDLAYHVDGLAFLFAALMALVGLATIAPGLGRSEELEGPSYPALLALLAAGFSFVFSANLITLGLSWVIFDLTFLWALAASDPSGSKKMTSRILNLGCLACLSLLAAALLLGDSSLSLRSSYIPALSEANVSTSVFGLILLAALVRVGLYPLHLWIPIGIEAGLAARSLLHLVPASAGLYLLVRLSAWAGVGAPYGQVLSIAGSLAFLIGALLAWAEDDPGKSLSFIMISQVGYAVTSFSIVESPTTLVVLWPILNLVFCLGLLFLSQERGLGNPVRAILKPWFRAAPGLAIASLTGVPLTLGFVGRWHLYHSLLTAPHLALLALSLLAEAFLFAALLRMWSASINTFPSEPVYERLFMIGAALFAAPILILGLHPPVLSPLMEPVSFPTLASLLGSTTIGQWATLFLVLMGGYLLHRYRQRVFDPFEPFWLKLTTTLRLEWFYGLLRQIVDGVAGALRIAGRVSEGGGYLSWIAVVGLLVLLFLRSG